MIFLTIVTVDETWDVTRRGQSLNRAKKGRKNENSNNSAGKRAFK